MLGWAKFDASCFVLRRPWLNAYRSGAMPTKFRWTSRNERVTILRAVGRALPKPTMKASGRQQVAAAFGTVLPYGSRRRWTFPEATRGRSRRRSGRISFTAGATAASADAPCAFAHRWRCRRHRPWVDGHRDGHFVCISKNFNGFLWEPKLTSYSVRAVDEK
jgi:hypothetical protein